jgi:LemA protein
MLNASRIILIVIVLLLVIFGFSACGSYNNMVNKQENVTSKWADVENVYQRRMDLIPNLVKTVQGAADFEKSTLEGVITARSKATSITVDPSKLSQEDVQRFQQAQDQLSGALSRLMVVVERYPELKANANFQQLQDELAGTENRIAFSRQQFNTSVQDYNSYIRHFPANMVAGMFGFGTHGYFQATAGADKAPDVNFDFKNNK